MEQVRRLAMTVLDRRLQERLCTFDETDWAATALVFAPHPDDETLGCGGVVAKKIAAGAKVHFVFVTDGAASHSAIAPAELRTMREAEAVEAVRRLGARVADVTFLRVADGRAMMRVPQIVDSVATLLEAVAPENVFVPHAEDPPSDHRAVNIAVREALARHAVPVTVFEYPVWYWYHWPWVHVFRDRPQLRRRALRQTIRTGFGLRALWTFNVRAYVGDVLPRKRAALAAHVSQMARPEGAEDWPILPDLGRGDFLARLLSDHEMFTRDRFDVTR